MAIGRPKRELTAFDVLAIVEELQESVGARLDKVLQPSERELVLRLKVPRKGAMELVVRDGKWLFWREKGESEGPPPPPFSMLLRKHLENRTLDSVEQQGFERIVVLGFEGYELVLELFGEGNVVLVREGAIVQPMRDQSWEHREVRPGRRYCYPPGRTDPRGLSPAEFSNLLSSSKGDIVRTLAVMVNLGGRYAEEVCARTGMEKNARAGKLPLEAAGRLHEAVAALLDEVAHDRRPMLVYDGEVPVDFSPIPLSWDQGLHGQSFSTVNELVRSFTDYWKQRETLDESSRRGQEELERLERQLEKQQTAVREYVSDAALQRRLAEAILAGVDDISALLEKVRQVRQTGGWGAVSRALARKELPSSIVEASPREAGIKVKLADAQGEMLALLDLRRSARQNASDRFAAGKEALEKSKRT